MILCIKGITKNNFFKTKNPSSYKVKNHILLPKVANDYLPNARKSIQLTFLKLIQTIQRIVKRIMIEASHTSLLLKSPKKKENRGKKEQPYPIVIEHATPRRPLFKPYAVQHLFPP